MSSSRMQLAGYECISELFTCYICAEKLREAAMCPHCTQIGCIACIKRWTDVKKECPHCREEITADQLIRVPIFDELIQQMVTDPQPLESSGEDIEVKICSEHRLSIEVYCAKCSVFICHECALWGKHRGHAVEKADDYYKKQRTVVEAKLDCLKDSLKIVLGYIEQTEKKMEDLRRTYSKSVNDIECVVKEMKLDFDKRTKSHMRMLDEKKHQLEAQSKEIAAISLELNAKMRSRSYSSILTQTGELNTDIESRMEKIQKFIASSDTVPTVEPPTNMIVPKYECGILSIHPFGARQIQGDEIYSNSLNIDGMTWRLKVYPNGHKEDIGKYLSVFIELTSGFERKANYQYRVTMLFKGSEKYPHKNFHKEFVSDFSDGESWGYRKFYDLNKLKEDGFVKNDTVVLKFGVRAPTYCQKCSDLNLYVQKLEQSQETLTQKVSELQQQLRAESHGVYQAPLKSSPSHAESRRSLGSHHSHSRSHTTVSHQHSYSDDFSKEAPPPHMDSDGARRSHHISTQQLQSPSHQRSTSHPLRRNESRSSTQSSMPLNPHRIERRRLSAANTQWLQTSRAADFQIKDDIGLAPACDQAVATPPKVSTTNQPPAAVVNADKTERESSNSQPSDLEQINLIIHDEDASGLSMQTVVGTETLGMLCAKSNSQQGFDEDSEHTHIYEANHLCSQPMSHDFEPSGIYERETATRRELNLSQVTAPTNAASKRLQKSLTDLSSLTASTTNLLQSTNPQLSQSVVEVSVGKKQSKGQRTGATPKGTPTTVVQQSMMDRHQGRRRDSAPNVNGPLGLASTVGAVLWNTNGQQRKDSLPLGHSGRSSSSSSINLEFL